VVTKHVFNCQLIQGHLISGSFGTDQCHSNQSPSNWRRYKANDASNRSDAGMLQGIVELDEKYIGGTPQQNFFLGGVHILSHYRYVFLLIMRCSGTHLHRTSRWGLQDIAFDCPILIIAPP
jgi:hypothetical protein